MGEYQKRGNLSLTLVHLHGDPCSDKQAFYNSFEKC